MAGWYEEGEQRFSGNYSQTLWMNEFRNQAYEMAYPLDRQGKRPRKGHSLAPADWDLAAAKTTAIIEENPRIIIKDNAILPDGCDQYLNHVAQVLEVTTDGDLKVAIDGHQFTLGPWEVC